MIKVVKIDTDELKDSKDPIKRIGKIIEDAIKEANAEIEKDNKACCKNCGDTDGDSKPIPALAKQCTTCIYAHVCKHTEEASNIEEFVNERCKDNPDVFTWCYDCKLYVIDPKKVNFKDELSDEDDE